ncbi:hypothetical protein ZIOFF_051897 [Zingiber officinale]|uniref:NAC domain-containing protein n=1 Tax=Zingiber officinale TaxID=94328 RepID=A0A8J5FLA2_ZINOF|nr:hypothetical protein ZIOFF_051897 [Zingiber officinale]
MELPPGFRFHPTDEEIITHYLMPKAIDTSFSSRAMGEVDLYKCEPWELPSKAKMEEKKWYFFCQRDRKYPTGVRTNRATEAGYWKATGKDKEIYKERGSVLVGMRKTLVFYQGRAPRGQKTNWVMHEFRLHTSFQRSSAPKACMQQVFHKNRGITKKSPVEELPYLMSSNGAPQAQAHAHGLDYLQLHHHHDVAIRRHSRMMEQVFVGCPSQEHTGLNTDCGTVTASAMRFEDYWDPSASSSGGGAMGWGTVWK